MSQPKPIPKISVLMYHQVGKFTEPKTHRSCYCDVDRFRAQMAFLKYAGYRVISMEQAYAALYGDASLTGHSVVLSFDDGYENFADHALPILQVHGYPSILFAVSGLLGQPARWLEGGGENSPLLSGERLRQLRSAQVEIGSHAVSHPRLSRLSPEKVRQEVENSKAVLEDLLGEEVGFFAYPYGDYSPMVRDMVETVGYKAALTCSRGVANTAPNPYEIPRKAISYGDSLLGFIWKLAVKNRLKERYA